MCFVWRPPEGNGYEAPVVPRAPAALRPPCVAGAASATRARAERAAIAVMARAVVTRVLSRALGATHALDVTPSPQLRAVALDSAEP